MVDPDLWALMQRVERLHYRADLLERASVDQPPAIQAFLMELAKQARELADHACVQGDQGPAASCTGCGYREFALARPMREVKHA